MLRAVDADGNILDVLVQNRRDTAAARRFYRRLLKKNRTVPRVVVTDKPRSYGAAHPEVMPSVQHRTHKGLNNRAENSHQPTRQRDVRLPQSAREKQSPSRHTVRARTGSVMPACLVRLTIRLRTKSVAVRVTTSVSAMRINAAVQA